MYLLPEAPAGDVSLSGSSQLQQLSAQLLLTVSHTARACPSYWRNRLLQPSALPGTLRAPRGR